MPKERKRSWDGDINEDDLLNEDNDKKVVFIVRTKYREKEYC